jgi:hypothetical protein
MIREGQNKPYFSFQSHLLGWCQGKEPAESNPTSRVFNRRMYYTLGWVDIGTRTKVPLKFVTYLSKITK